MSIRPNKRLTRRGAERALDGSGTSGVARVDEILSKATAPASPFELNREADMVALFRATGPQLGAGVKLTVVERVRMRLAAAKLTVAAGAAILLAGGGVAYAASTGNLPEVLGGGHKSPGSHSTDAPGQNKTPGAGGPESPGHSGSAPGQTSSNGVTSGPNGTPHPSLKGLCNAFQAKDANNPGKAQENPAFSALATAAGGKANIATYCVNLIGEPGSHGTQGAGGNPDNNGGTTNGNDGGDDETPSNSPTKKPHPTNGANATKNPPTPGGPRN